MSEQDTRYRVEGRINDVKVMTEWYHRYGLAQGVMTGLEEGFGWDDCEVVRNDEC